MSIFFISLKSKPPQRENNPGIRSFTLIELLIVIGILTVLAVVVILVINPSEFLKQSRDSTRMTELQELNKAIAHYQSDGGTNLGLTNKVYVSIPDSSPTCANLGLSLLPSGWFYGCSNSDNYRKVNGTGWIPIPFTSISFGSTLEKLPIDPVNTTSTGNYYTYVVGGSWKFTSSFESEKYAKKMNTDGGTDPALFETGSNLSLLNTGRGLVGYWKFDEGSDINAADSSGNGNNGTLTNSPTWTSGKIKGGLSFDGVDDYVVMSDTLTNPSTFGGVNGSMTIVAWVNSTDVSRYSMATHHIGGFDYFSAGATGSGKLRTMVWDAVNNVNYWPISNGAISNGNWFHIVFIFEGGKGYKFYINGSLDRDYPNSNLSLYDYGSASYIGYGTDANTYFKGLIDDVRVYNRALSAAEISAIYNATK